MFWRVHTDEIQPVQTREINASFAKNYYEMHYAVQWILLTKISIGNTLKQSDKHVAGTPLWVLFGTDSFIKKEVRINIKTF